MIGKKSLFSISLGVFMVAGLFAGCRGNIMQYDQEYSGFQFPEDTYINYEYERSTWDRGSRFTLYQFDEQGAADLLNDIETANGWIAAPLSKSTKELYDRIIFPKDNPLPDVGSANGYYKLIKLDSPGDFYILFYDSDARQLAVMYDRD